MMISLSMLRQSGAAIRRNLTRATLILGLGLTLGGCFSGITQQRGVPGTLLDSTLSQEIRGAWVAEDPLITSYVTLDVFQARALLTGSVPDERLRDAAVATAFRIDGVAEVLNEIEVSPSASIGRAARDSVTLANLRSDLLLDNAVNSQNYVLQASNGVIYILGAALSQGEVDRVLFHARTLSNVRKVVNYIRLQSATDPGPVKTAPTTAPIGAPAAETSGKPSPLGPRPLARPVQPAPGPTGGPNPDDDIVRDPGSRSLAPLPVQTVPLK